MFARIAFLILVICALAYGASDYTEVALSKDWNPSRVSRLYTGKDSNFSQFTYLDSNGKEIELVNPESGEANDIQYHLDVGTRIRIPNALINSLEVEGPELKQVLSDAPVTKPPPLPMWEPAEMKLEFFDVRTARVAGILPAAALVLVFVIFARAKWFKPNWGQISACEILAGVLLDIFASALPHRRKDLSYECVFSPGSIFNRGGILSIKVWGKSPESFPNLRSHAGNVQQALEQVHAAQAAECFELLWLKELYSRRQDKFGIALEYRLKF